MCVMSLYTHLLNTEYGVSKVDADYIVFPRKTQFNVESLFLLDIKLKMMKIRIHY